jgi:hypothetical protein
MENQRLKVLYRACVHHEYTPYNKPSFLNIQTPKYILITGKFYFPVIYFYQSINQSIRKEIDCMTFETVEKLLFFGEIFALVMSINRSE